jgi:hypothetical protein
MKLSIADLMTAVTTTMSAATTAEIAATVAVAMRVMPAAFHIRRFGNIGRFGIPRIGRKFAAPVIALNAKCESDRNTKEKRNETNSKDYFEHWSSPARSLARLGGNATKLILRQAQDD